MHISKTSRKTLHNLNFNDTGMEILLLFKRVYRRVISVQSSPKRSFTLILRPAFKNYSLRGRTKCSPF